MRAGLILVIALAGWLARADAPMLSTGGPVTSVSGDVIYVQTPGQILALHTNARTQIWKGKVFHDLSLVVAGDQLYARYHADESGNFIADAVWVDITNVYAVITDVTSTNFDVLTNPNADPDSSYRQQNKKIYIGAGTEFIAGTREDLRAGRNVQIVGVVIGDREVQATRVTVYEGDRPVRMRSDAAVTRTNGTRQ